QTPAYSFHSTRVGLSRRLGNGQADRGRPYHSRRDPGSYAKPALHQLASRRHDLPHRLGAHSRREPRTPLLERTRPPPQSAQVVRWTLHPLSWQLLTGPENTPFWMVKFMMKSVSRGSNVPQE